MKKKIILGTGLLTAAGILLASPALLFGFELWETAYRGSDYLPFYYQINRASFYLLDISDDSDREAVDEAIKMAFDTWSNISTSGWYAKFDGPAPDPSAGLGLDGVNLVSVGWKHVLLHEDVDITDNLAVTEVWRRLAGYYTEPGTVVETDIEINPYWAWSTSDTDYAGEALVYYDIETVMLHEVGHAVGLDHVTREPRVCVANTGNDQLALTNYAGTAVTTTWAAEFSAPQGVVFDPTNWFLFVADTGNSRIVKLSDRGDFLYTTWGDWGEGIEEFKNPQDVAVDTGGNVYVADTGNNRVQKFTSGGLYIAGWGSAGDGDGKFDSPRGIAVDWLTGNNYVYVADTLNHRIQKFDSDGNFIEWWGCDGTAGWNLSEVVHTAGSGLTGEATAVNGGFSSPEGVAVDAYGYVYVADTENNRIQKFSSDAKWLNSWGKDTLSSPESLDADMYYIYVMDTGKGQVRKYNRFGTSVANWDSTGRGIAVDLQDQDKVMYLYYTHLQRTLTQDEIDGASYLYPGSSSAPSRSAGGGCFVATAAFGSPLAKEVKYLSRFRDEYLLRSKWGRAAINLYYRFSPALAGKIRENENLKTIARVALRPLVWFTKLLTNLAGDSR